MQVPQNQNKWIELKFQESPERSCKLIIMALTLSTSICTSTSRAVHRLSPSQYLRLFPGHHRKPTNLLLPRHPPTRFTLAFSRRRNNNPVTTSSSKKKKVRKWTELVGSVPEILKKKMGLSSFNFCEKFFLKIGYLFFLIHEWNCNNWVCYLLTFTYMVVKV